MRIASAPGRSPSRKIRNAIVGLGGISPEAMLRCGAHTADTQVIVRVTDGRLVVRVPRAGYGAGEIHGFDTVTSAGTEGSIELDPAHSDDQSREQRLMIGKTKTHETLNATHQFGGERRYFSACLLGGIDPQSDAEEGFADLRVIEGVLKALETGRSQALTALTRSRRIDTDAQKQTLSLIDAPEPVPAAGPSRS